MEKIVKDNNLKVRSYSFFESLFEKFNRVKSIDNPKINL